MAEKNSDYTLARLLIAGFVLLLVGGLLVGCQPEATAVSTTEADESAETKTDYSGKKILWVDSYHEDYDWSMEIEAGLHSVLDETNVEFEIVRMDTKRNSDEESWVQAAEEIKAKIEAFEPDVVIASDDNAQKYLVVPYLKDTDLPVVFCAVNWDASAYGFPTKNVTGMLEVDLVIQLNDHLKNYAEGEKLGYIGPNSTTEEKVTDIYNDRFFDGEMQLRQVNTFDEFKETFLELQNEVDMIIISNDVGIEGWDKDEAIQFLMENASVPTGARNTWMAPYVLVTLGRSGEEQGEWAAQSALNIIDGTAVADIPVAENKKGRLILNLDIAEKMEIVFPPSMLRNAEIYASEQEGATS